MHDDVVRRENTSSKMNNEQQPRQQYEQPSDRADMHGFVNWFHTAWPSKPKQESRDKADDRSFFEKFIDKWQRRQKQKSVKNDDDSFFEKFLEMTQRSAAYRPSPSFLPIAIVGTLIFGSIVFTFNIWKLARGAR